MRSRLRKLLARFLADESAPSAIEYAMMVAGVAVIIIAVVYALGGGASTALEHVTPAPGATTSPSSLAPQAP
jgi:Flp pilus assembly pilin Flp